MSEEVQKLRTSCNGCVFAEYISMGVTTQTGCELGRLNKFVEQERAVLDDSQTFYLIDGICNTCRGSTWREQNKNVNLIATVEREIQIGIDIVLYSFNDARDKLDWKISKVIRECIKQQKIKPRKIVVVIKNDIASFRPIYDIIQSITEPDEIPFQLIRVVQEDATIDSCVEMGINKCTSQFVATFDIKHMIPNNFILNFNKMINYDMKRVLLIEPLTNYSGMILATNLFKTLGKNYNIPIFEKVKELAEEQEKENMIVTWSEL